MRRILATVVILAWGLWFGGLIALFMAVTVLFATYSRHVAGQGAAHLFRVFNGYQLALAAIALLFTFGWRVLGNPRLKTSLFTLFALATIAACVIITYVAPHIEALQAHGLTDSRDFSRLHGLSMAIYLVEVIMLLIAGCLLPWMRE
jgi:glucan phosphoethanolaminetransferase (alkaline phosphatase superfamily)